MKVLNNKFSIVLITLLLVLNAVSLYFLVLHHNAIFGKRYKHESRNHDHGPERRDPHPIHFMKRQLNLTDDQFNQLQEMRKNLHTNNRELRRELGELRMSLFKTIGRDSTDFNDIIAKMTDRQIQLELALYDHFTEIRKICTEEQKQKYDKLILKMMKRFDPSRHDHHFNEMRKRRRE